MVFGDQLNRKGSRLLGMITSLHGKEIPSMNRIYALVLAVGLLFCWGIKVPAMAQDQKRDKRSERMEILTMWRMMQELDLDKELADRIFSIRREFLAKRKELRKELRTDFDKLRRSLETGPGTADDKELKSLLDGIRQKRKMLQSLWEKQYEEVSRILSVRQQAKLMLFLKDFRRELRKIRRTLRGEQRQRFRGRPRTGFGPPGQRFGQEEGREGPPGTPPPLREDLRRPAHPSGPPGRWNGSHEDNAPPGQ
jgi:hypothetical protein